MDDSSTAVLVHFPEDWLDALADIDFGYVADNLTGNIRALVQFYQTNRVGRVFLKPFRWGCDYCVGQDFSIARKLEFLKLAFAPAVWAQSLWWEKHLATASAFRANQIIL